MESEHANSTHVRPQDTATLESIAASLQALATSLHIHEGVLEDVRGDMKLQHNQAHRDMQRLQRLLRRRLRQERDINSRLFSALLVAPGA